MADDREFKHSAAAMAAGVHAANLFMVASWADNYVCDFGGVTAEQIRQAAHFMTHQAAKIEEAALTSAIGEK